jgi:predicted chitinase
MVQINRKSFYDAVRAAPFGGRLSGLQVAGMEAILNAWDRTRTGGDRRWLAYMLATTFHETAGTMQPVRETLAPSDMAAAARLESAWARGRLGSVKTPYWRADADGKYWLGRGLVQLTHKANYQRMARETDIDIVADPGRAMEMDVAVAILFCGMEKGLFTGRRLADYFTAIRSDWSGARRIINGLDRAADVASYGLAFHRALVATA